MVRNDAPAAFAQIGYGCGDSLRALALERAGALPGSLPNIAELIANGEITIGVLSPVGCVAIATDGHNTLAMLKRRRGETLAQLLARLDQALTEDVYTDEINPPTSHS